MHVKLIRPAGFHVANSDEVKKNEVAIHTLPHLKYVRLVSVRPSHLLFKIHLDCFACFQVSLYLQWRVNSHDKKKMNDGGS